MYSHVALNLPTILAKYPGTDLAAPARDGDNPLVQTSGEAVRQRPIVGSSTHKRISRLISRGSRGCLSRELCL